MAPQRSSSSEELHQQGVLWSEALPTLTRKSEAFLYANNEQAEKEIRKTSSFTIAPKNT
jgi:hypothetical protein